MKTGPFKVIDQPLPDGSVFYAVIDSRDEVPQPIPEACNGLRWTDCESIALTACALFNGKFNESLNPKELEIPTAENWLSIGTIWATEYGSENTYYTDQFGLAYFCKNYPTN